MAERVKVHGGDFARAAYTRRSLEGVFPEIKPFLSQGARVLDVGCGPGTITLDVAENVAPGSVIGIDLETAAIQQAQALASERNLSNVRFAVGDSQHLPFGDAEFDLTYSHGLLEWVMNPVGALKEHRRVTRPGGWVCARMLAYDTLMMYPRFAYLWKFYQALHFLADRSSPGTFLDRTIGCRTIAIFNSAGFPTLQIKPMVPIVWYPGQDISRVNAFFLMDDSKDAVKFRDRLVDIGATDSWAIDQARREWNLWLGHPHAVYVQTNLFAAAEVPR